MKISPITVSNFNKINKVSKITYKGNEERTLNPNLKLIKESYEDPYFACWGYRPNIEMIAKFKETGKYPWECTPEEVFKVAGINYETNEDGLLILDEYRTPCYGRFFSDYGINEDDLLKKVAEIKGNARFGSGVTNLGELRKIGGHADFSFSKLKDLGKLENIGGNVYLFDSEIDKSQFDKISCGMIYNATGNLFY